MYLKKNALDITISKFDEEFVSLKVCDEIAREQYSEKLRQQDDYKLSITL